MSGMNEEARVSEILREVERNREWFRKHYEELRASYEGKVFAIKNSQVVYVNDGLEGLLRAINERSEDMAFLLLASIPPKGVSFIL